MTLRGMAPAPVRSARVSLWALSKGGIVERSLASLVATLAAALAGCATADRAVESGMILPDGAQQTEIKTKQKFLMAVPVEERMPDFPSASVQQAETAVCVEFVVTEEGQTSSVRQIDAAPGCEAVGSDFSGIFLPEVRNAVESWTFFGAALCDFEVSEDECDAAGARLTPIAVRLAYRFRFTQAEGRRRVTSEAVE